MIEKAHFRRLPVGLEDSSTYPVLFAALLDDTEFDWTEDELGKLASGNLIRTMRGAEAVRDEMAGEQPRQVRTYIYASDFIVQ